MRIPIKSLIIAALILLAITVSVVYVKDKPTAVYYTITNLSGRVFIKYQAPPPDKTGRGAGETYEIKSNWIPLTEDMKIGPGVTVKTEIISSLDLLLDEGMALRIKENTVITINEDPQGKSPVQAMLSQGKILARLVVSKLRRISSSGTYKLRVDTENAVCGIRGTIFSVDYHTAPIIATNVAVLEGNADVYKAEDFTEKTAELGGGLNVPDGKKTIVTKRIGALQDISPEEREELLEARELKIGTSIFEHIHKAVDVVTEAIINRFGGRISGTEAAEYGMSNLVRALINHSLISGKLPDSLQDIKLERGTYQDPWGTDYLYVRINAKKAILISVGPDMVLNTPDDIYRYVNLPSS